MAQKQQNSNLRSALFDNDFQRAAILIYTVVAKKDKTTLLVKLLTKSFYPFWPPLYSKCGTIYALLTIFMAIEMSGNR